MITSDIYIMNTKIINAFVLLSVIGTLGIMFYKPVATASKAAIMDKDALIEYAQTLPNGAFKSNLFTVLGADAGGSSEELNELLKAYSKMKISELKNNSL